MERTITIIYGDELNQKQDYAIQEKQKVKNIISRFVKEQKIPKKAYLRSTFGYKLFNAKMGNEIDNKAYLYDSAYGHTFLLLPDEKSVTSEKRDFWIVVLSFLFAVISSVIKSESVFSYYFFYYFWEAFFAAMIVLFIPMSLIIKRTKKKIAEKNKILIDKYIIQTQNTNRTTSPSKQAVKRNNDTASYEKKENPHYETQNGETNGAINAETDEDSKCKKLEFYFNNFIEFVVYAKEVKESGKDVIWLKGDKYEKAFNDIYSAFERKKYGEVIYLGEKCFNINPVAISVRFEMCEAYLALGKLEGAEQVLNDMCRYMVTNYDVAHFYRKWGFILCEKKNWKAAAACYKYSLQFDSNPNAVMELAYIKQQGYSGDIRPEMIEDIFIENNIPLIKEEDIVSLDDLESQSNEETDDIQEADNIFSEENGTEKDVEEKEEKTVEVKPEIDEVKEIKAVEVEDSEKNNAESDDSIEKAPITPLPKVLFCRKCGAKLIDGSAFCNKCGTKI